MHRIRSTFAASRTGAACRSPTMARAVGDTARKFTTAHGARYPQGARRIRKAESRQRLRRERRYIFLSRSRRRYRRNRSVRFYRHLERTGSAFPRLPRRFAPRNDNLGECRGAPAPLHGLIPLYKALTARKGHAASVKRQSRQRLRSDRRYSQIWQRVRSAMVCTSGKCLPEIATSAVGLLAMTNLWLLPF